MTDILVRIAKADAIQIDEILKAAIERKKELYPEWDLLYYAHKRGERDLTKQILALLSQSE